MNSDSRKNVNWKVGFLKRLVLATFSILFLFVLGIVLLQDAIIFPGAVSSLLNKQESSTDLPANTESGFVVTEDQKRIEFWRLAIAESRKVAIIFHGNGGDVRNFFGYQEFFSTLGISSYGFDYRGYGNSSGWPSEKGLYLDGEAIVEQVLKTEKVKPEDLIIVGVSIGSGPAAYIAEKYQVGSLVLFSPYESLTKMVEMNKPALIGYLSPFVFYSFPVAEYVSKLKETCLLVAHGRQDNIIPFSQGEFVYSQYQGNSYSKFIASDLAGHNNILLKTADSLAPALTKCFQ